MPVGSWPGAEASFVWLGVFIQIIEDHVVGNIAAGGGETAPCPESLSPIALADIFKLLLYLARSASLCPAHKVADRNVGRDLDEHMHMITRQSAVDDLHAQLAANLPDDLSHPQTHFTMQHLETVFWCPDNVITMMKCRVASA